MRGHRHFVMRFRSTAEGVDQDQVIFVGTVVKSLNVLKHLFRAQCADDLDPLVPIALALRLVHPFSDALVAVSVEDRNALAAIDGNRSKAAHERRFSAAAFLVHDRDNPSACAHNALSIQRDTFSTMRNTYTGKRQATTALHNPVTVYHETSC